MDPETLSKDLEDLLRQLDTGGVESDLTPRLARVSQIFGCPKQIEGGYLKFMTAYIRAAPGVMSLIRQIATHHRLESLIEQYLKLAGGYLASSVEEIHHHLGREATANFLSLLQGAYIFHRMFEDLDDKVQGFLGIPVLHDNMMDANLIVHEVIGDRFANRLDSIVESLIKQSQITKAIIEAELDKNVIQQLKKEHLALSGKAVSSFAAGFGFNMMDAF